MKMTLTTSQAVDMLLADSYANWSYRGARAIIDHIEQMEENENVDIELEVEVIRDQYTEYESALEAAEEHGYEPDEPDPDEEGELSEVDENEKEIAAMEWLERESLTIILPFNGGVIVKEY